MSDHQTGSYYVPAPSGWPILGSVSLFLMLLGAVNWLHKKAVGPYLFLVGALFLAIMMYGWFGAVIKEGRAGKLNDPKIDQSFRQGMLWFIFTEVMFFAVFFGALFYARVLSVPWLGGWGSGKMTHLLLWPDFHATWPLFRTPDPKQFQAPSAVMAAWGLPAINTAVLLASGATITAAHWAVVQENRLRMKVFQAATIILGVAFLMLQAHEYWIAYTQKGLRLTAGIYGTTFFALTGFHAAHVTVGVVMLCVIFYRMFRGDFNQKDHFGFAAVSWYWHFVDVIWLLLFVFVYWL